MQGIDGEKGYVIEVNVFHYTPGSWLGPHLDLSAILDAVDGTIARDFQRATPIGGVLDLAADRVVEAAVLLGIVSYRLGKPLTWNAKELRATNEPEADRFLRKEYRKPWTL